MQMSEMPRCNIRRKSRTLEDAAELSEEGLRCYEGGDEQGAEKRLRSACAIRPSVPQAHYNLGYFYSLPKANVGKTCAANYLCLMSGGVR